MADNLNGACSCMSEKSQDPLGGTMIGKWILIFGVVLIVVGVAVWLIENLGLPVGRLPGDIQMRGKGWFLSFPIVTSIVVSVVLTVLLNLFFWFFRR